MPICSAEPGRRASAILWRYPTILQDAVGPVSVITYHAADGLEMQGVLTLPPGRPAKGLPVVVLPHGGPEARDYVRFLSKQIGVPVSIVSVGPERRQTIVLTGKG